MTQDLTIALLGALIGSVIGYLLAKWRDDRLRAAEYTLILVSDAFTEKRLRMRSQLSVPDADFQAMASRSDPTYESLRKDVASIFNFYEMVCYLRSKKDLDKNIFNGQMASVIKDDYRMVDPLIAAMEREQRLTGSDLRRPFFGSISKVVGRE